MSSTKKDWLTLREVVDTVGTKAPVTIRGLRHWCECGFIPDSWCYRKPNPTRVRWYIRRSSLPDLLRMIGVMKV